MVWDPGSEIREKTYSGSRIQGSKRHRIPDPDPQHCFSGTRRFTEVLKTVWENRHYFREVTTSFELVMTMVTISGEIFS
jgi:hypothetical protein